MKHNQNTAISTDLVLVGGGHSHLFVLKHLAMNPIDGLRLTLVTRDLKTPYSGMLPGYIAGHYRFEQAHIDLQPLARYAGARLIHGEVSSIDPERQILSIPDRPDIKYDLLSINIGSRPARGCSVANLDQQFAIKPIDQFLQSWARFEKQLSEHDHARELTVVGGGAGGVELVLALEFRLRKAGLRDRVELKLVTDQERVLMSHPVSVSLYFTEILQQRSVALHCEKTITDFDSKRLTGNFSEPISSDTVIWTTSAQAPEWLQHTGLALDKSGFIAVHPSQQSISHENVFAAGDIASVGEFPRPKSGVFAVRQGVPLAKNLVRYVRQQPLVPFRPQLRFLSLVSTGDKNAVASRGRWQFRGPWCWWLKNWIDQRFIQRFSDLPVIKDSSPVDSELSPMRCGGCGSKLGRDTLETVLSRIQFETGNRISEGNYPDDAAITEIPTSRNLVQTVDHFRSFVGDPYLFGKIAANHALGDMFAMGVTPHSAMVIVNVEFATAEHQTEDLYQLMSGVTACLKQSNVHLIGGHSGEAAEMSCGLSINGFSDQDSLLLKSGMQTGDLLVLTKPIGSGVLMAADMRAAADGEWIEKVLQQMQVSNQDAAYCLREQGATACTDVTGFGLAGHLFEMARASQKQVELLLPRIPLYDGTLELLANGYQSSLQPQNRRIRHSISDETGLASTAAYPALFDPQTAGGLLASIPAQNQQTCLGQLKALGYQDAVVIGRVSRSCTDNPYLKLVSA